jgi:hypothetical protein
MNLNVNVNVGLKKKETTTKEIAKNVFLHTSKMQLVNTEDLAHTVYTYSVIDTSYIKGRTN